MLISIKNAGPISSFEIDTDVNFNLLLGENNIGKSYSITLIYCIIKNMIEFKDISRLFPLHLEYGIELNNDPEFIDLVNFKGDIKDISEFTEKHFKKAIQATLIRSIEDSLKASFPSLKQLKKEGMEQNPTFTIKSLMGDLVFEACGDDLRVITTPGDDEISLVKSEKVKIDPPGSSYSFYFDRDGDEPKHSMSFGEQFMLKVILPKQAAYIKESLGDIEAIHYLPASRSGLYQALSAFGQIIAELSKKRSFLSQKIELPGISEPVSDYFIKLSELTANKKEIDNKNVAAIANKIEKELLNGEVIFNNKTKQLMFKPLGSSMNLELSSTSSMVSEIAPIVTYLRYILSRKVKINKHFPRRRLSKDSQEEQSRQIIIIEEPEAHLHPEIQVKLTDAFEDIIENEVNMIITSHSNYIFNKVNNLILSNYVHDKLTGFNEKTVKTSLFKKSKEGAIVFNPETDSLGIEDENFIDVTDVLLKEKFKLLEEFNLKEASQDD